MNSSNIGAVPTGTARQIIDNNGDNMLRPASSSGLIMAKEEEVLTLSPINIQKRQMHKSSLQNGWEICNSFSDWLTVPGLNERGQIWDQCLR